jgi:type II secretory pathway pseudopilin PulG
MNPLPAETTMRQPRARAGFTLIEMMLAILLTMLVFGITVPFFRMQTNALDVGAGRLDALQNARYAQNAIDRELRLAGGVTGQPIIVQAAPFAITFNVDLVSRVANDPNSTYYDPTADSLGVESWEVSRAKTLPTSAKTYPVQMYNDANGVQSSAETISYFLYVDASSGRTDLYTLFRRVNDRDSTVITKNIWIPASLNYFFRYYATNATDSISMIPMANLPLYWDAASHMADSIRVVEMRISGLYRDVRKARDVTRTVYHKTRLLNSLMLEIKTCGAAPLPPTTVVATQLPSALAPTSVHITWNASPEEAGGEKDVATYLIQKRLSASVDWQVLGNTMATGSASYQFDDFNPTTGTWIYGVVAQDCSPSNSTVAAAAAITNP